MIFRLYLLPSYIILLNFWNMGYGAHVVCNCYKEGLATEPPHKKHVHMDEEDGSIYIDTGHLKDKDEQLKWWLEFDEWRLTACSHEDMDYAYERLANMSGMGAFRTLVEELGGAARFPTLAKYLPVGNGGMLPFEFTNTAHHELSLLKEEKAQQKLVVLQEAISGDIIASTSINQPYNFVFSATISTYGIDSNGFFIVKLKQHFWERNKVVFQSSKFRQTQINNNQFKFEDLATGSTCIQSVKLYPIDSEATQDYFLTATIQQASIATEYAYIIEPLFRILKASLETGNPVCWV